MTPSHDVTAYGPPPEAPRAATPGTDAAHATTPPRPRRASVRPPDATAARAAARRGGRAAPWQGRERAWVPVAPEAEGRWREGAFALPAPEAERGPLGGIHGSARGSGPAADVSRGPSHPLPWVG